MEWWYDKLVEWWISDDDDDDDDEGDNVNGMALWVWKFWLSLV